MTCTNRMITTSISREFEPRVGSVAAGRTPVPWMCRPVRAVLHTHAQPSA